MNTICKYVLLKLFVFPKLNCLTGSHVWLLTDYVHVCILCSSYLPFPQLFSFSLLTLLVKLTLCIGQHQYRKHQDSVAPTDLLPMVVDENKETFTRRQATDEIQ